MNEETKCHHCGAKIVRYKFSINQGIARFVIELFRAGKPVKTNDLGLTYSQRTNSQKARYWGLAQPFVNEESKRKAGWWVITEKGKKFCRGEIKIPRQVIMFRNNIEQYKGDFVAIDDIAEGYQYRSDYQDQVAHQALL